MKGQVESPHPAVILRATIPAGRLELTEPERIAFIRLRRQTPVAPEELAALERGLSQRCPDCDRPEAAHFYCSGCLLPMGLADWFRTKLSPSHVAAIAAGRAKGHAMSDRGSASIKTANFGPLAGVPLTFGLT